jgi:hypothetical protein
MKDVRGPLLVLNPLWVTLAEDGVLGIGFFLLYDDILLWPLL